MELHDAKVVCFEHLAEDSASTVNFDNLSFVNKAVKMRLADDESCESGN